jgi:hypothetical protein
MKQKILLTVNFKLNFTSNSGHVSTCAKETSQHSIVTLASLAFNISGSFKQLDMRPCAEFPYSMAVLTFSDPVLVSRICSDVQIGLGSNEHKSAVVGLILTSLGVFHITRFVIRRMLQRCF